MMVGTNISLLRSAVHTKGADVTSHSQWWHGRLIRCHWIIHVPIYINCVDAEHRAYTLNVQVHYYSRADKKDMNGGYLRPWD